MSNTLDKNGIDPKFKDVKVGDYVWTIQNGATKVDLLEPDETHPVGAEYGRDMYTIEGKLDDEDVCASAWTFNPFDPDFVMPYNCPFTEGQVLMGRNSPTGTMTLFKFDCYDAMLQFPFRGKAGMGYKFARELTQEEKEGKK